VSADAEARRVGWFDMVVAFLFLVGIYLGVDLHVTTKIPIPAVPAGFSGLILLWRRRDDVEPAHLAVLLLVFLFYLGSILSAADVAFLDKRTTGLIQITYSLLLSYGIFLTFVRASREQIAGLFLGFCLFIAVGCLLEDYGGLRPFSDAVRLKLYSEYIYDADLRDQLLYGHIRPKLFTSEPSAVTFAYTLFCFAWLVFSRWRWKLLGYGAFLAVGLVAMPGPTLLLMLLLLVPYELFLAGRNAGPSSQGADVGRWIKVLILSLVLVVAFAYLGSSLYAKRLHEILSGDDASFFYRVIGPALVARSVAQHYPVAGTGLTGELFIAKDVATVYMQSPLFSAAWDVSDPRQVLTNYFWLHWIYLGVVWGAAILAALTVWLKVLGVPSALFCWTVWAILGQASGSYVGPKTWAVLLIAAAGAVAQVRTTPVAARPALGDRAPTLADWAMARRRAAR
jgi:hypothetical protein